MMLRHSTQTQRAQQTQVPSDDVDRRDFSNGGNTSSKMYDNAKSKSSPFVSKILFPVLLATSFLVAVILYGNLMTTEIVSVSVSVSTPLGNNNKDPIPQTELTSKLTSTGFDRSKENYAFESLINRSKRHQQHCDSIGLSTNNNNNNDNDLLAINNHTAHLPPFGFLDAFRSYRDSDPSVIDGSYPYRCELPPENECGETQFTVIFMAYNPDRLNKLLKEIKMMLTDNDYSKMVAEIIIVWNGERHIDETDLGKKMLDMGKTLPLRISYPLKAGFPNDLMNRYHPRLGVKTKAIMYYDDDGPFYSYQAVLGGFELWKRNSNAQIGAMARKIDLGERQVEESRSVSETPNDSFFVSHCPTKDNLHYNYQTFANFDARMVLPSGSFLHSNYLCFLWHPMFEDVREYVRNHPVNPDDGTVSMLVSQLAGKAPRVYSRRLPPAEKTQQKQQQQRRRLMDGINWDKQGAHDKKMHWGRLRSDVANSLARYFGSINSGSLGWCYGTEYHINKKNENLCHPEMAKVGMLPWMNTDSSAGGTCP
jgi:hypothetical protein